jgi:hypothetical protein
VPQDDIAAVIRAISALVTGKAGVVETCDEPFLNRIIFLVPVRCAATCWNRE